LRRGVPTITEYEHARNCIPESKQELRRLFHAAFCAGCAGTLANRTVSPSAAVGCVKMAF
jgi:hypothetical protein